MTHGPIIIGVSLNRGSLATYFRGLSQELAKRGHTVVIVTPEHRWQLAQWSQNPSVCIWPSYRPIHLRDAWFFWKLVRQVRPDAILSNFSAVNIMVLVSVLCGVSMRVVWHHTLDLAMQYDGRRRGLKEFLLRIRKSIVYSLSTHIIAVSEATLRDVANIYRVNDKKAVVRYPAMEDPLQGANPIPLEMRAKTVCCVGRFDRTKGQEVLLEAIPRIMKSTESLLFVFVGDGPELERCKAMARTLGIEHSVSFRGRLAPAEVVKQLSSSLVSVIPSRSEAFGFVAVESLSVGTPIVASEVGGLMEVVRHQIDGILVPSEDSNALADGIVNVIADDERWKGLSLNGRHRFLDTLENSVAVPKMVDWIEEQIAASN